MTGCVLALAGAAYAVQENSTIESAVSQGAQGITREPALARIAELEADTELAPEARAGLLESYRKIVADLDTAGSNRERAEAFQKAIQDAPPETNRLRQQLEQAPPAFPVISPDSTVAPACGAREAHQ